MIIEELRIVAYHEKELADAEEGARQAEYRQRILKYSLLIMALNVVASFLPAFWLFREITSRLSVISVNAKRFASGKELQPALTGTDEIAEVGQGIPAHGQRRGKHCKSKAGAG